LIRFAIPLALDWGYFITNQTSYGVFSFMFNAATLDGLVNSDIRKLADQLAQDSQRGEGAHLPPESVDLALAALRAYADMLGPPKIKRTRRMFQIEVMDERGWPQEVLAVISDGTVAQAAYDEAVKQHPDRKVRLRRGTSAMAESPQSDAVVSRAAVAAASH
jgi:hypothetical protein